MNWSPAGIAVLVIILGGAFAWDVMKWRRKPAAELEQMITGRDWQHWKNGLKELKRRGEEIDRFVPLLLDRMLADKRIRREAARITLVDVYPHLRPDLKGYTSADDPAVSRDKLAPLLARYPLPDPSESDVSSTGFLL